MSNSKLFRSAVGGFNREDVNKYIKETDERHIEEVETLKSEIANISNKLEETSLSLQSLTEKNSAMEGEIDNLNRQLKEASEKEENLSSCIADKDAKLAAIKKEADFYKAESSSQINVINSLKSDKESLSYDLQRKTTSLEARNQTIEEKNAEIEALKAKIQELEAALNEAQKAEETHENISADDGISEETLDRNSDEYKLSMYDKISSQLGDIMINANRNADDIISKAKDEAESLLADVEAETEQKRQECYAEISRIKSETEEEAAYIRERLSFAVEDILANVSSDLHGSFDSCVREISTCITDMQYEIKTLLTKITGRSLEMQERMNYYQNYVSEGVDKRLSGMDEKYGIKYNRNSENE